MQVEGLGLWLVLGFELGLGLGLWLGVGVGVEVGLRQMGMQTRDNRQMKKMTKIS